MVNNSKRSVADILAGLGATETTSPVLAALISPVVPITEGAIVEVKELFNHELEKVDCAFPDTLCFQVNEVPSSDGRFSYSFSMGNFSTTGLARNWNDFLHQMAIERYYHHEPFCEDDATDELLEVLSKFIIDKSKLMQCE